MMERHDRPGTPSAETFETDDGRAVVFDPEHAEAWIKADNAVAIEAKR
jgi:hypothetical protein